MMLNYNTLNNKSAYSITVFNEVAATGSLWYPLWW